jgi:hypothetical protein
MALPYMRFSIRVMALFITGRMLHGQTLAEAGKVLAGMSYQRGQFWIRRLRRQAEVLSAALVALLAPPLAGDYVQRVLGMLQEIGWIAAHRFLFAQLRVHLLGWPAFLAPDGMAGRLSTAFGRT